MKSDSKKFDKKESQFAVDLINKEQKKEWLISYEIYRVTTALTVRVDVGTKIVEGPNLKKAYESMRTENQKIVITNVYEL